MPTPMKNQSLKELGKLHWKEVLDRNLYSEGLLFNKKPRLDIRKQKDVVVEHLSFAKIGVQFDCIFDYEFLVAKLSRFLKEYCHNLTKDECMAFIEKAYYYQQEQQIDELVEKMVATLGHDKSYWKNLLEEKK